LALGIYGPLLRTFGAAVHGIQRSARPGSGLFAQLDNNALKQCSGIFVLNGRASKTREQISHSLAREMGLNPSFFKAGARGGEV
jgi:hypothetical protein